LLSPNYRFSEYKEEWIPTTVGALGIFKKGSGISVEITTEVGYPAMMYGDIYVKYDTYFNSVDWKIPELVSKQSTKVSKNVLLFTCSGETALEIGKCVCYVGDEDIYIGGDILSLTPNKNTSGIFVAMAMNRFDLIKQRARVGQGHSIVHINQNHIAKLRINIPSLAEQERISTFMNLYYKKCELQREKIERLDLTLEHEITRIFGRLQGSSVKINTLITIVSNRNKYAAEYPVLSVNNVLGFIAQCDQFEDREVASDDKSDYKIVTKDVFAYNPARINVGSIARLKHINDGIVSPMYICFKCKNHLSPAFFEYYVQTADFRHQMYKRLEGSVRQCLSFEALGNIPFILPKKETQLLIVNYLNSLQRKIALEQRKLDALLYFKKGLLQQLFV
jgi:type I restriction enzyme S subunit